MPDDRQNRNARASGLRWLRRSRDFFGSVFLLSGERRESLLEWARGAALVAQFFACADGNEAPLMNNADSVSHFFGDAELMGRKKNRHAGARTLFQNILDDAAMLRVQTDHGFIDNEYLRGVHQRGHNRHALAGAVRKTFQRLVYLGAEVEPFDQRASGRLDVGFTHSEQLADE